MSVLALTSMVISIAKPTAVGVPFQLAYAIA